MPLRGHLDSVTQDFLLGWAQDADAPESPVSLIVSVDGRVTSRILANRFRPDLAQDWIGSGSHAFELRFDRTLNPLVGHSVAVRREGDGAHVPGSPWVLEPRPSLEGPSKEAFQRIFSAPGTNEELDERLAYLLEQTERLRMLKSDLDSGANERRHRRWETWHEGGLAKAHRILEQSAPRALVIDDRVPKADHDAGANAILAHIQSLQRLGFEVSLAPINADANPSQLEAAGITCCMPPWYTSVEDVLKRQQDSFSLVYLHRHSTAARYVVLARDYQPRARLLYNVADLHHLRELRQAEVEQRPELKAFSERTRLRELTAAWQSDVVVTHSTAEAAILRRHVRPDAVHVVPWTIDAQPTAIPFVQRKGLAFIGGYGHQPNVDAALWLVDAVMPMLESSGCGACLLIGSDMPNHLKDLRRYNVDPVGYVPALSAVFDRVRLTVAPLAFGAGVKGKVLDSLAAGVPCVCTPAAAEGLDLPQSLLDLVGSTPAELARSIKAVHEDEDLNRICSEAGLDYIRSDHSATTVDALMAAAAGVQLPITC